jgi:nucleotide-binding universal stress UspA family protein
MFKKMLVLLDGSNLSEVVFTYAQELAGRLNLDLELLHVCNTQEAEQLPMRRAYMEHMAEVLQTKAEEIRARTGSGAPDQHIKAKGAVVVGYPPEEILKYVDQNNIDLVMLSTHGRSGINMWDIGNVANKVIHAARIPIWLVPAELREEVIRDQVPNRTMVIPLDGSKMSEKVIPYAIDIAKQRGAETAMVLVNVEEADYHMTNLEQLKRIEATRNEMKKYLDGQAEIIKQAGLQVRTEILSGDPATAIIDFLKNNPTQLVAMATHGHSGLSRMIFGSVTENIIHLVKKTPIFLVRPQE